LTLSSHPDRRAADKTRAALASKGVKAFGGTLDVADRQSLRGWVEEAAGLLGGLDIFVSNVSALERAWAMDDESWRLGLEIDIMGTVTGIEAAIPHLEKSGNGSIVVIGTIAALEVVGAARPYPAVKAALAPYVKALSPVTWRSRGCAPT
jgi:NAD(P)-dependent dehydrogenase (short-subunit alcohol dehydrogenase family)